jgi:predicted RNA binding protein YcfA (HicA-like mRNA interferase family)
MTRGLFNWQFSDVEYFLKQNGFVLHNTNASHYYYHGIVNGSARIVCVPFHGKTSLKPRTLKGIILQSGLSQAKWLKR